MARDGKLGHLGRQIRTTGHEHGQYRRLVVSQFEYSCLDRPVAHHSSP